MSTNHHLPQKPTQGELLQGDSEPTPSALLQLAIQQNLDIDKLEKLMGLQERWQKQQARKDFLAAISLFQAKCPILEKKKKVDFTNKAGTRTKYSYAPLGEIIEAIRIPMADTGLSIRWEIKDADNKLTVTCIVSHVNGHSEKTEMQAAKDESGGKNDIQQRGSAITYLQRYTLISALGISTADEDTDGHKDEAPARQQPVQVKPAASVSNQNGKVNMTAHAAKPWLNPGTKDWDNAFRKIHAGVITMNEVESNYRISKDNHVNLLNPNYVFVPLKKETVQ